jgi:hypothetical protein
MRRGCPTDGELRLAIDAGHDLEASVRAHLDSCVACRARLADVLEAASVTTAALQTLQSSLNADTEAAYAAFRVTLSDAARHSAGSRGGTTMGQLFERRSLRFASALVALVAVIVAVTFTPMRTVADDFLNQFRVQKFAAITIPMDLVTPLQSSMLNGLTDDDKARLHEELGRLGAFDTTFEFDLENLPAPVSLDDAAARYGEFDTPDDLPEGFAATPNAYVTEAGSASYTLNTANAQALVDELGLPIYTLPDPADYPTLEFSANIPAAIVLEYQNAVGERIIVGQMASPSLNIPDGINMNLFREDILRFPGLPADLVAQLRAIDDWEHTLIVPVPEGADSDDITINGEPGLLIEHALGSAVLWEKDGVLFAVIGQTSADSVRDIADSMH